MTDFVYKKHSNSYLIRWTWRVQNISVSEIKNIVHDVTKKHTIMCIDQAGFTFLTCCDNNFWNNDYKECHGVFVSTEQEAIDVLHLINKARMWNLLKN